MAASAAAAWGGAAGIFNWGPKGMARKSSPPSSAWRPAICPASATAWDWAVNGAGKGGQSRRNPNAAKKQIIIISDGAPSPPQPKLMAQIKAAKISISTVSVYPHQGMVPPTMQQIAQQTGGRFYGPIEKKPHQLPQIFIKEGSVVRRALPPGSKDPPLTVKLRGSSSHTLNGV